MSQVLTARQAVELFAATLDRIEGEYPAAVSAIRNTWNACYNICGHKALARYLLTGDLERVCRNFER